MSTKPLAAHVHSSECFFFVAENRWQCPAESQPLVAAHQTTIGEDGGIPFTAHLATAHTPSDSWAAQGSTCGCYAVNIAQPVIFCPLHAATPDLYEALKIAIQQQEAIAEQLDTWAHQSRAGGWSTNQVDPMLKLSASLRRNSALAAAIAKAEGKENQLK